MRLDVAHRQPGGIILGRRSVDRAAFFEVDYLQPSRADARLRNRRHLPHKTGPLRRGQPLKSISEMLSGAFGIQRTPWFVSGG